MLYTISTQSEVHNGRKLFRGIVRNAEERIVDRTAEYNARDEAYSAAKELRDRRLQNSR